MLSVAGGKLTTYRKIALDALARLRGELGLHRLERAPWPLPGAAPGRHRALGVELPPDVRAHLLHLYGNRAADVVALADDEPILLERLHPDGPDILAQAVYGARYEWASTADDVVRRRTTVAWRGLDDARVQERVAAVLGSPRVPG